MKLVEESMFIIYLENDHRKINILEVIGLLKLSQ